MLRHAALDAGRRLVADADVGEGAAHHHFVMATVRAVRVEVHRTDLVLHQVPPGGAVRLDAAGGRDVVRGDAVAEDGERSGKAHVAYFLRLLRHVLEEGRVRDVGRRRRPVEGHAALNGD